MSRNQKLPLKFEIYDRLVYHYKSWYIASSEAAEISKDYSERGRMNFPIKWHHIFEDLKNIQGEMSYILRSELKEEIEENLLFILDENSGVFYLNKWVKFINQFSYFSNGIFLGNLKLIEVLAGTLYDEEVINSYIEILLDIDLQFRRVKNSIIELLRQSVWYKKYPDLINVNEYPYGIPDYNRKKYPLLDTSSSKLTNEEEANRLNKLTWSCKPAVAGYIISELIRAGYIEPPIKNGELSLNKLANICSQLFDVSGYSPSRDSWRNVVDPERNALPDSKRAKLNLPDLDQLT
ncbi:hypothetical protein [Spirosoma endbachense]|uniref:Uncharacterized protein n=1 Tax=Spirosoma endbachense TaxID=2666025 RepID=A0A6P1VW00_9BACT|nr:hypothetical protein [Spirosoma endbachense]QHV97283.1 hypothetical protein GJR95_20740 [Spirosoma endbachense]